jgi:HEAT repeat protein
MSAKKKFTFNMLISALLNDQQVFPPRYLHHLSDLNEEDTQALAEAWPKVSLNRRKALLEDLVDLTHADDLLWFEAIGKLAIKDTDPAVRMTAIDILREYELRELIPEYLDLMQNDPSAQVRASAASALAVFVYMGEVDELPREILNLIEDRLLITTQSNDETLVRRRALEALGFSSRKEIPPLIEQAYNSQNTDWILSALNAMGRSADKAWKSKVAAMLNHPDPSVRAEAASAAGELEIKSARMTLLKMLRDPDLDVRMASSWALSQIGGEGVRAALEKLYNSTDDEEEASLLESALDNLDFTDDINKMDLFEVLDLDEDEDPFADYELEDEEDEDA